MRHPADHSTPRLIALAALASSLSCTSPEAGRMRLEHTLQTQLQSLELPLARRSTINTVAPGIRVQLRAGTVEVDDLALWAALAPEDYTRLVPEKGTPWTHVRDLKLQQEDGKLVSLDEPLMEALSQARQSAKRALEGRDASDPLEYAFFATADTPFRDVVHVLYNAGHAELPGAHLVFARPDGSYGWLPMAVPKFCAVPAGPDEPIRHTARCQQLSLHVSDDTISIRGRNAQQATGECKRAFRAKLDPPAGPGPLAGSFGGATDGTVGLSELLGQGHDEDLVGGLGLAEGTTAAAGSSKDPPARPPEPCATARVKAVVDDPAALSGAIEELTGPQPPCRQLTLSASDSTTWGRVLTVFDALWSQEHDLIYLEASSLEGTCESG